MAISGKDEQPQAFIIQSVYLLWDVFQERSVSVTGPAS